MENLLIRQRKRHTENRFFIFAVCGYGAAMQGNDFLRDRKAQPGAACLKPS